MMPIFTAGAQSRLSFPGPPMANAAGYRLRISHNPYFSSTIVDRKVKTAEWWSRAWEKALITGWSVLRRRGQGIGGEREEPLYYHSQRQEHDRHRSGLDPFVQHGHVIEVTGKTEAGARVMVNGREVPVVGEMAGSTTSCRPCRRARADHDYGAECQGRSEYLQKKS